MERKLRMLRLSDQFGDRLEMAERREQGLDPCSVFQIFDGLERCEEPSSMREPADEEGLCGPGNGNQVRDDIETMEHYASHQSMRYSQDKTTQPTNPRDTCLLDQESKSDEKRRNWFGLLKCIAPSSRSRHDPMLEDPDYLVAAQQPLGTVRPMYYKEDNNQESSIRRNGMPVCFRDGGNSEGSIRQNGMSNVSFWDDGSRHTSSRQAIPSALICKTAPVETKVGYNDYSSISQVSATGGQKKNAATNIPTTRVNAPAVSTRSSSLMNVSLPQSNTLSKVTPQSRPKMRRPTNRTLKNRCRRKPKTFDLKASFSDDSGLESLAGATTNYTNNRDRNAQEWYWGETWF